ncbi:MAG TPA: LacI family DNA-binding transcriptional regulator [Clostridia bacterium]|nr:LacI family DNA-binding transcriptional regulator [Clostridia bacterium]
MATIKEIALACGVSAATVSKALNNASDVGADTARRVKDAARSMGYFPNAAARALKTNRSLNIGLLFADATNSGLAHEFFSLVLNSLKEEAERAGYDVTFISRDIGHTGMSYLEHCRYRKCDGVVIATVLDYADPQVIELAQSDIPLVAIDYVFDNRGSVLSDNVQGMRDLVRYVHSMGHKKIAFIHGDRTAVTKMRLASFHRTCEELGLKIPDEYIVEGTFHEPSASARATRKLLSLPDRPSCILFPDDYSFLGGMNEIESAGLSIPEDISVCGFDGIHLSQVLRPRLSTVRQKTERLGAEASKMLVEAIEAGKTFLPHRLVVPCELIVGESVRRIL